MAANEAIIRGVASILQTASAALAQLGSLPQAAGPSIVKPRDDNPGGSLADAAAALASVASAFGGSAGISSTPANSSTSVHDTGDSYGHGDSYSHGDGADASMSTTDFCSLHQLEPWVGEALDLLNPDQRAQVMDPPMNTCHARNLNGIVVSRIKQAVPLDQRLGVFVQINGLGEGVVDRLGTLTQEQAEAVMESGLKIQKAANPSGVAMRRITDVLRSARTGQFPAPSGPGNSNSASRYSSFEGNSGSRERSRTPAPSGRSSITSISETPSDIQSVMDSQGLEWWCGEVLKRLSLYQRQQVLKDVHNVSNARNPSGVVMSRVKQFCEISELMSIFIDINQFDGSVIQELWNLSPEQQNQIISPGIFLQNVRNPSTAVRSRIKNVLAGNDAFGKPL